MAPPRGNPRGQQEGARGRGGGTTGQSRGPAKTDPRIAALTMGVKRPGYGQIGRPINITTNHFECDIPKRIIHHYDGNFFFHLTAFRLLFLFFHVVGTYLLLYFATFVDKTRAIPKLSYRATEFFLSGSTWT